MLTREGPCHFVELIHRPELTPSCGGIQLPEPGCRAGSSLLGARQDSSLKRRNKRKRESEGERGREEEERERGKGGNGRKTKEGGREPENREGETEERRKRRKWITWPFDSDVAVSLSLAPGKIVSSAMAWLILAKIKALLITDDADQAVG